MRKANKIPFIILLCLAIAFIAATLALLFIPERKPLKVIEKPAIVSVDGEYSFQGKIKNISKDEIILDNSNFYLEVGGVNASGYKTVYTVRIYEDIILKPDGELDLSKIPPRLGNAQSAELNRIIYEPNDVPKAIYGGGIVNGNLALFALLTGVIGAAFLLIAIVSYTNSVRNAKRANNIIEQIRQTLGGGVYAEGGFGNKAANRAAAAKTTASVFGAVISTLFIGFGRYRVYSQSGKTEFIITETAVYSYINGKFQNITNEIKSAFINPVVTANKNSVTVKGDNKNLYFTLRASGEDNTEILTDLKNIFDNQEPKNGETDKNDD